MTKIVGTDSLSDIAYKMSEGNPGAINVLVDIIIHGSTVDPDNILGGIGIILSLDSHGIYGPDIWILYKDVCGENLANLIALLRGVQLGIIPEITLDEHIHNDIYRGKSYEKFDSLFSDIRAFIPNFASQGGV